MKTLKRLSAFIGAVTIVVSMMLPAVTTLASDFSQYIDGLVDTAVNDIFGGTEYVVDRAGLFTADQAEALNEEVKSIMSTYNCGYAILTDTDNGGRSPEVYAADFLYDNGYDSYPGATVFYISMDQSDRCFVTISINGNEAVFNEARINELSDKIFDYFADGQYYNGTMAQLSQAKEAFSYYNTYGEYKSDYEDYSGGGDDDANFGTAGIIAAVAGAIGVGINKKSMASSMKISPQISAREYVTPGSFNLRRLDEHFLYTTLTKVAKPKDNDRSHGSGFTSGHSSSGGHFSGGGRRF